MQTGFPDSLSPNVIGHHPRPGRHSTGLRGLLAALVLPLLLLAQPAAQAAEMHLRGISLAGPPPAPDYPVPNDRGQVFYLQRSANANTVVYAARFGPDGVLERKKPLSAYWRRYNSRGQVAGLSLLERKLAYGVSADAHAGGGFDVDFRAIPQLGVVLEQRGPGRAVLTFAPEGQPIDLTYGYLQVDDGGLMPEVTGLRLFGRRRADGQRVQIDYGVTGGEIGG